MQSDWLSGTVVVGEGTPNAGKGTQLSTAINYLGQYCPLTYMSTGDYLRSLGERTKEINGGGLFSADKYISTIAPGIAGAIQLTGALAPGFALDGGVREDWQAVAIRDHYFSLGYKRMVMACFDLFDISVWNQRREARLKAEGRPDDKLAPASLKWVTYWLNRKVVLTACLKAGYQILHLDASGEVEDVSQKLSKLLVSI